MEESFDNKLENQNPNTDSIRVLVRVRPLNENERTNSPETTIDVTSSQSLLLTNSDHKKTFTCSYDAVLGPLATQAQVYDQVKDCTFALFRGVNSTIFAYGQTGSGKTHSMYGPPQSLMQHARGTELMGVIPRAINHIFELATNPQIIDIQVHCSFVQIYNENLYDLLRDGSMNAPLTIREDSKEIYVQGLSEYSVKSVADTLMLLKVAEENRAIRETHMNQFSSRSHSIFTISIEHKRMAEDGGEIAYRAKFNLVDLAGSEKWDLRRDLRDEHIAEMTNINLSLHTLGKCISSLAKLSKHRNKQQRMNQDLDSKSLVQSLDKTTSSFGSLALSNDNLSLNKSIARTKTAAPSIHIPYRESKLTRLLQDSLGGNAKTFLIATVSPAKINCEESISTLKFADRAKQVMVQATSNEVRPVDHAMVTRLKEEVEILRSLLRKVVVATDCTGQTLRNHALNWSDPERQLLFTAMKDLPSVNISNNSDLTNNSTFSSDQTTSFPSNNSASKQFEASAHTHGQTTPPPGGGLEYIISLERALNKEQVHAQHLTQKNETLIKELEELKYVNMQLSMQTNPSSSRQTPVHQSSPSEGLQLPEKEVKQVVDSVHLLLQQHETMVTNHEQIQKIMKKFFQFKIEEDEMKEQMMKIFEDFKESKNKNIVKQIHDNFSFLEFLVSQSTNNHQNNQNNQNNYNNNNSNLINNNLNNSFTPSNKLSSLQSHSAPSFTPKTKLEAISVSKPNALPPMQSFNVDFNSSHLIHSPNKANNTVYSSSSVIMGSGQQSSNASFTPAYPLVSQVSNLEQTPLHTSSTLHNNATNLSNAISVRVRGPGNLPMHSQGAPSSDNSSLGWFHNEEVEEDNEEKLKQELKKAKKKQKQKEKLQQWMKEKEDRALAEQQAADEERKAMLEAEHAKELKRKEYVLKQKQKLSSYQDKIKTEAEKIQELINLGIDPKSLNL